jgi:sulfopyruvate decarboxylase subunit alpha
VVATTDITSPTVSGRSIIAAMRASDLEFIVSLPDITTSDGLLRPLSQQHDMRHLKVCKEDEGIGICAGLSYTHRRALMLMQNTGLFDSLNAVRALGGEYSLPICMMVGLLSKEPERAPRESLIYSVRIVEPVLDAMEIDHTLIETEADVAKIKPAIDRAYEKSRPVVLLIGRRPTVEP